MKENTGQNQRLHRETKSRSIFEKWHDVFQSYRSHSWTDNECSRWHRFLIGISIKSFADTLIRGGSATSQADR
jgi:hypothetical protein